MTPPRRRLDVELVRRGLASSRERAQAEIVAGRVLVAGAPAVKPGRLVAAGEPLELSSPGPRFVSRGGEKLAAALERFAVTVDGRTAVDAGASTGGFTDCLLQRGASCVVAVDVGRGQFHESLRNDRRVRLLERTNVRHLTVAEVGGAVEVVTADLSFISLRTVAPALVGLAASGADLVLLVKPQFEAGKAVVARGRGVVTDPDVWHDVLERVRTTYQGLGAAMMGSMASPLLGPAGNAEFFVHLAAGAGRRGPTVSHEAPLKEAAAMVASARARA